MSDELRVSTDSDYLWQQPDLAGVTDGEFGIVLPTDLADDRPALESYFNLKKDQWVAGQVAGG